jgi:hypothetical protein
MVKPLVLFTGFADPETSRPGSLVDHLDSKIFPEYIAAGRTLLGKTATEVAAELEAHIQGLRPQVVVNLGNLASRSSYGLLPAYAMHESQRHNSTLPIDAILRLRPSLRADDMPPTAPLHNSAMGATLALCEPYRIRTAGLIELPASCEGAQDFVYSLGQLSVAFYRS